MKAFFSLLYNQMAWTYDSVAFLVSVGMWTGWVKSVVPFLQGPNILELGHGPGHLQAALGKQAIAMRGNLRITGLDKSVQMGRLARKRLVKQGLIPNLVHGEAQKLPFPDETFNQVVATFPSEYISSQDTLEEIRRVLVRGGNFVTLPVAWITGKGLHQILAAKLFRVTGQAPEWDDRYLEPARRHGFEAQVKRLSLPGSVVLILIITKPES
jgi:ubiquinone/menaquinone biosynthesis C-methylase UbiE